MALVTIPFSIVLNLATSRIISGLYRIIVVLFIISANEGIFVDAFNRVGALDREERVEAWVHLIRYLVGLAFVIFGLFSLLYRPIATRVFLRRFDKPEKIENITGVVLSCDEIEGHVKRYEMQVQYSANYVIECPTSNTSATEDEAGATNPLQQHGNMNRVHHNCSSSRSAASSCTSLLEGNFLKRIESNWKTPRGSTVNLIMLKGIPRSACTREWIEQERDANPLCGEAAVLVATAFFLFALLMVLCIVDIKHFPENLRSKGWFVLIFTVVVVSWVASSIADHNFEMALRARVLSAIPLKDPAEVEMERGRLVLRQSEPGTSALAQNQQEKLKQDVAPSPI